MKFSRDTKNPLKETFRLKNMGKIYQGRNFVQTRGEDFLATHTEEFFHGLGSNSPCSTCDENMKSFEA